MLVMLWTIALWSSNLGSAFSQQVSPAQGGDLALFASFPSIE